MDKICAKPIGMPADAHSIQDQFGARTSLSSDILPRDFLDLRFTGSATETPGYFHSCCKSLETSSLGPLRDVQCRPNTDWITRSGISGSKIALAWHTRMSSARDLASMRTSFKQGYVESLLKDGIFSADDCACITICLCCALGFLQWRDSREHMARMGICM